MADPKTGTGKKPPGTGRRLYTDENPRDTVKIKFATPTDARKTVAKVKKISKPECFIMEDGLLIVSKLQKLMRNNLQIIGDTMITGGVDNMEKYKYLLGQANTYQIMLQEISNLLDKKEQKNEKGTVIDLNARGTKS
jgi:hypothetical protein